MKVLADRLRKARKAAGLSQRELAGLLHVSQQAVSGWETGYRQPDAELLPRLAEALGTSVAYLLGETDDPSPSRDGAHRGGTPKVAPEEPPRPFTKEEAARFDRELADLLRHKGRLPEELALFILDMVAAARRRLGLEPTEGPQDPTPS